MKKAKLDQFVLDIEFLLISVIQGVALATLGTNSVEPITTLHFESWIYIASGFLIILIFWSGAIIHALSFIDWPLDITHNFLYFLLSFIEVLAFNSITHPALWFIFIALFFTVACLLYFYDLTLIKKHKKILGETVQGQKLYTHIYDQQLFELRFLLPPGLIFAIVTAYFVETNQEIFIGHSLHVIFGIVQALFLLFYLINFVASFKKRATYISESIS